MDDPLLLTDTRMYWLTGTPAKRLPAGEPEDVEVTVTRSFAAEVRLNGSLAGQLRPPQVSITIDVRGHHGLIAPREGGYRTTMRVVDSEASWEFGANRVRLGGGYIEVLCPKLRGFGLGALFMNKAIGWAQFFHPDASVKQIKVGDDEYRDRRRSFYEEFGFRFASRTDPGGNLLSEPMAVSGLRFRAHPMIESDANLQRR